MNMKDVLGLIMGGGQGSRLYPLTKLRSKPAVPIAGKYRLIDIPISNCLHAGIDKIAILTQYNSVSLHRHIQRTYARDMFTARLGADSGRRTDAPQYRMVPGHGRCGPAAADGDRSRARAIRPDFSRRSPL